AGEDEFPRRDERGSLSLPEERVTGMRYQDKAEQEVDVDDRSSEEDVGEPCLQAPAVEPSDEHRRRRDDRERGHRIRASLGRRELDGWPHHEYEDCEPAELSVQDALAQPVQDNRAQTREHDR